MFRSHSTGLTFCLPASETQKGRSCFTLTFRCRVPISLRCNDCDELNCDALLPGVRAWTKPSFERRIWNAVVGMLLVPVGAQFFSPRAHVLFIICVYKRLFAACLLV